MSRLSIVFLTLCLLLSACGSVPPTPTDRFYRLQPVNVPSVSKPLSGAIAVQTFRADSLYAERPIVYVDEANLRQLSQYHYHLWLYAPAQLIQEHLVASFGNTLELSGDNAAVNLLEGRVIRFERVVSGRTSKAVVALELRFKSDGKSLVSKTYQAEQGAVDELMGGFNVAMEQALGKIYTEFAADLARGR